MLRGFRLFSLSLSCCLKRGLDHIVKILQEARTVSLFKRSRTSRKITQIAEMGHQVPVSKSIADGFRGENTAFRVQYSSAFFNTSRSKRNISRYSNIVFMNMLHNPVIGRVKMSTDND